MNAIQGVSTIPSRITDFFWGACFWFSLEVMVKVHVVDLESKTIAASVSVRAYLNQTITEFKQLIAQVCSWPWLLCFEMLYASL